MEKYRVRFERRRGHFLVLEGDPPITREHCDEMQLRMLQFCDVPGLMNLAVEEVDGRVAFRYSLENCRMLSQTMRTVKWSMADLMSAICRLAEIMEECRLYLLDAERIRLEDDCIFVGESCHDLRFVYVPSATEDTVSLPDRLQRLVIHWLMQLPELEGAVVQQVLRLIASPDFVPANLRRYARDYLADQAGSITAAKPPIMARNENDNDSALTENAKLRNESNLPKLPADSASGTPNLSSNEGWRWFQPQRAEPQQLSGLLGSDPEPFEDEEPMPSENSKDSLVRRRIWLICAAIGLSAAAWRWGAAGHPGRSGLLFSIGVTLLACGAAVSLWNPRTKDKRDRHILPQGHDEFPSDKRLPVKQPPMFGSFLPSEPLDHPATAMQTGALGSDWQADRTQQLADYSAQSPSISYYLEWESGRPPVRVPLNDLSVIIGRSVEAAKHVDDTSGVSRAHLELLRTQDGWQAKDLGSRNGTRLNEKPMVPYEPYILHADDCLVLAESRYRFKRSS